MEKQQGGIAVESIVVGTDGSWQASQAVVWAAMDAVRKRRPLHIVHCHHGSPDEGHRLLTAARALAGEGRPALVISTELSADPPTVTLGAHTESAAEIVIGHRGRSWLGSTGLRLAGQIPGPVVVVRDPVRNHATVLAAVDGYDISEPALEYACVTAAAHGSRLLVVEVRQVPPGLRNPAQAQMVRLAVADTAARLRAAIAPWRARFSGLDITERVIPGDRVATLVALSAEADLAVLGSRGLNRLRSTISGSVSHGLLHHAQCPVAVVRPSAGQPARARASTGAIEGTPP